MSEETNQQRWPFGPAPRRECAKGGEHDWKVIDLFQAADPPAPSFECTKCGYLWSRGWTQPEFDRVILATCQTQEARDHYAVCNDYPLEPPYTSSPEK